MKEDNPRVTESTGNIFEDLGFPHDVALNLRLRAVLMLEIEAYIKAQTLTQREAAEFFGVHQPRINDIMHTRTEGVSLDALVNMLARTGKEVQLHVLSVVDET